MKLTTPKNIDDVDLYRKRYDKFRGVDFSTDPTQVSDTRSPLCQNLISDLAGFPEKRTGWRTLFTLTDAINGLFRFGDVFICHAGTKLYTFDDTTATEIYAYMNDARSTAFSHGGNLYILDGADYKVITQNNDAYSVSSVIGFTPTTVIGAPAAGGGTTFEAVNLISPKRINSMIGDNHSFLFQLDTSKLDKINSVKVEGVAYTVGAWTRTNCDIEFEADAQLTGDTVQITAGGREYTLVDSGGTAILPSTISAEDTVKCTLTTDKYGETDYYQAVVHTSETAPVVTCATDSNKYVLASTKYLPNNENGTVDFAIPPAEYSGGGGIDNVVIDFSKTVAGYADRIRKCTICASYGYYNDNRIFFTGNPDYPNTDWQSGLDDPTYFPDTGYTKIGSDSSAIMGYLHQSDNLAIIKEQSPQDSEIYLRSSDITDDNEVYFPVKQGLSGLGAISKYCFANLRDDPLFLTREGVYALISTSVTQEKSLQDRSYYVNAKLTKEDGLENAVAIVWSGYYIICVNDKCYVADRRQRTGKSQTEQYSYEWYYWTNIPARVFVEYNGELYFGTSDGRVCKFNTDILTSSKFNDDGDAITAVWTTKSDDFDYITRKKTLTKKGCGVMIKPYTRSSINVYAATDWFHETLIQSGSMDILDFSDIDFSRFTFNTLDSPQVVALNKKIKKFIVLQLIFENDTVNEGFGVYGAEVQYAIGNYVK